MTPPVSDAAWVAGGVLAATGELDPDLSVGAATERLTAALVPGRGSASWTPPDPAVVTGLEATLAEAWTVATGALAVAAAWDTAVVRLRVWDPETLAVLGRVAPPGPAVVAHAGLHARRMAWRWPVRVGVSSMAAGVDFDLAEVGLVEVGMVEDGVDATFEILVLDGGGAQVPDGARAACVVVLDAEIGDVDPSIVDRLGAAAIVVVPGTDRSWLAAVVRHLACGRPLDVAVGLAHPGATVLADDGFLELTSAPEYGRQLSDQLRWSEPPVAADLLAALDRLLAAPFDADGRAGAALAAVVTSVAAAGGTDLTTVERHLGEAMANGGGSGAEPDPGPDTGGVPGAGAEPDPGADVDRGADEAAPGEVAPDRRRLQAQVVDPATKKVLGDRFVPGRNQIKVRIAAAVAEGVAVADALFASPTPGREADLTVEIIAGDTHRSQTLKLPAVADSKWTRAVPFVVPADADRFRVFVQVLFGGRVVQSATLDRPVLQAGAPAPAGGEEGLRLAVDASTPPATVHRMTPAGGSLTIVPSLTGEPQLLRLGEKRPVDPEQLAAVAKVIRQTLLGAFLAPPANLEGAAGVLTRLAVHGSLLHQQLGADAFDEVEWVHVSTFGAADLPVELVYTHPMPDSDEKVPVCPTALAGADRCAADCPDRNRSDVVCPFGFWATSKVVERRGSYRRPRRGHAGRRALDQRAGGGGGGRVQEGGRGRSHVDRPHSGGGGQGGGGGRLPPPRGLGRPQAGRRPPRPRPRPHHPHHRGRGRRRPGHQAPARGRRPVPPPHRPALRQPGRPRTGAGGAGHRLRHRRAGGVLQRLCRAPVRSRGRAGGVGHLPRPGQERGRLRRPLLRGPARLPGHARHPPLRGGPDCRPAKDGGRRRRARPRPHRHRRRRRRPRGNLTAMVTVELLPAGYGDAILVTYGQAGAEPHRVLIDGGQAKSFPTVADRLRSFNGPIDLFVVTHVDTDHIGGAVRLLSSGALAARFQAVWFNGFVHLDRFSGLFGPIHGEKLTALIVKLGLPWNEGWPDPVQAGVGGPVVVRDAPPVMDLPGGATATVLSPTPQKLARLLPVWQEVVEKAGLRPRVKPTEDAEPAVVAPGLLGGVSLEDLAALDTDDDAAEANGSSIAFLFEFEGVRVLFGADAHADALVAGLAPLASPDGKIRLDACKLPHHGSKGNCTQALVDLLDCPLWMISTNGRRFHHPDDAALARVIHGRAAPPTLVWNYRSDRFLAFTGDHPPATSGYTVDVPAEGAEGITVRLGD